MSQAQVLVDDQDPTVVYSGPWQHDPAIGFSAQNDTISGVGQAGSTATLDFTGLSQNVQFQESPIYILLFFFCCRY